MPIQLAPGGAQYGAGAFQAMRDMAQMQQAITQMEMQKQAQIRAIQAQRQNQLVGMFGNMLMNQMGYQQQTAMQKDWFEGQTTLRELDIQGRFDLEKDRQKHVIDVAWLNEFGISAADSAAGAKAQGGITALEFAQNVRLSSLQKEQELKLKQLGFVPETINMLEQRTAAMQPRIPKVTFNDIVNTLGPQQAYDQLERYAEAAHRDQTMRETSEVGYTPEQDIKRADLENRKALKDAQLGAGEITEEEHRQAIAGLQRQLDLETPRRFVKPKQEPIMVRTPQGELPITETQPYSDGYNLWSIDWRNGRRRVSVQKVHRPEGAEDIQAREVIGLGRKSFMLKRNQSIIDGMGIHSLNAKGEYKYEPIFGMEDVIKLVLENHKAKISRLNEGDAVPSLKDSVAEVEQILGFSLSGPPDVRYVPSPATTRPAGEEPPPAPPLPPSPPPPSPAQSVQRKAPPVRSLMGMGSGMGTGGTIAPTTQPAPPPAPQPVAKPTKQQAAQELQAIMRQYQNMRAPPSVVARVKELKDIIKATE